MIRSWRRPTDSASSADRRADWTIASIITSRASRGSAEPGVRVHELGQELLVERAPVDPDADRLVVLDGDPDDRREVLVVPLRADVARVDPVLGEGGRGLRVLRQQEVAVVVEVADDRDVDAQAAHLAHDPGTAAAAASVLTVIRTSCEPAWASRATWIAVASASAVSVFVIDWTTTGWALPTSTPPTSTLTVGRAGRPLRPGIGGVTAHRRAGRCRRTSPRR